MHFVHQSVRPSVCNIPCPCYMCALMDYHLTGFKCCPHWDDVQWPWTGSIPQRSRSHKTFKGQSTLALVRTINFRMHWWITIKLGTNVVLIETMCNDLDPDEYLKGQGHTRPEVTVLREYLGYQSNNWYFLFSHSWPVVVYHFGQFQGTSQVERKTKCSKKNSRPFDCLVKTNCIRDTGTFSISKQRHWIVYTLQHD